MAFIELMINCNHKNKMTFISKELVLLILLFIAFNNFRKISSKSKLSKQQFKENNVNKFQSDIFNIIELNDREIKYNNTYTNNFVNQKNNKILARIPCKANDNIIKGRKLLTQKNKADCNINTCSLPNGICLDPNNCICGRLYKNLKFEDFTNKNSSDSSFFFLDYLQNSEMSKLFINDLKDLYAEKYCHYKRKSQIIGFVIESITMIGIGHLYLFRIFHGILKMSLFLSLTILAFFIKKIKSKRKSLFFEESSKPLKKCLYEKIINFFYFLNYVFFMILHVFDIYMLATNSYNDGFGFRLISWNSI